MDLDLSRSMFSRSAAVRSSRKAETTVWGMSSSTAMRCLPSLSEPSSTTRRVCVVERATEAQWRKKSERSVSFSKWCLVTVKMSTQQISMRERLTFMTIGARCLVCSARSFFVFPGSTRETVYSGGGPNRLCVKSNPSPLRIVREATNMMRAAPLTHASFFSSAVTLLTLHVPHF